MEYRSFSIFNSQFLENLCGAREICGGLKEEIAEVVGFELDDPRVQSVTVTDVEVSENLRDAKVYVLIDGSEDGDQRRR